ncbi:Pleckstrin homology-like domain [Plasmopara halstedii]|uniref:Pleckstrin homology-like domain n=1 Tax=Plasmopara halstedii TaxID=4781 RepID=A0A0N7L803_PLAHL|nr:Pleckstrin homology-like domain [Plasmopara halstedii]CEG48515.1 Pleckstrin homology-like domain [Plasmopara halstedii]|eukprot:XP_024584884.1 Pleckstrin homology-like domain [Plasmopara halstedii]
MHDSVPDYCGWGAKQGSKVRTWKNRYFVLRGCELIYYSGAKSDGSGAGLGEKGRLKVVNVDYTPDRKNGLLIHGEGRTLKMTTASTQESRVLFRKIKEAIGERKTSFEISTLQTNLNPMKSTVDKEGWLLRKDYSSGKWENCYVSLSGKQIQFESDQNAALNDSLTLQQVELDDSNPLSLRLIADNNFAVCVAARTKEEIERWDRLFAAAIRQPVPLRHVKLDESVKQDTVVDTDVIDQKHSPLQWEGWLETLTEGDRIWQKRYMSLVNGILETREGPIQQHLARLIVTDVRYSSVHSNTLEIEFTTDDALNDGKTMCARTDTIQDLDIWMGALCDAVGKPRLRPTGAVSEPFSSPNKLPSQDHQNMSLLPPFPENILVGRDSGEPFDYNQQPKLVATYCSSDKQDLAFASSNCTKRGWLYERDDSLSSWKQRYFLLNGSTLYHNKNVGNVAEKLGTVLDVSRSEDLIGCLCVKFNDGGSVTVNGETKADTDAWYTALYKASLSCAPSPSGRASKSCRDDQESAHHSDHVFRGWLLKRGQHFKTWKRRYFVLESSRLAYSASAGSEILGSGVVFDVDMGDSRPFCLNIRFQNGRLLHVVAPTEEAFSRWFFELRKASNVALAVSFLSRSNGRILFDEEFDNDVTEDSNDVVEDFTEEDLAEYDMNTTRGGEGASLWIAAMQNKPEYDKQSSSFSDQSDRDRDPTDQESAEVVSCVDENPADTTQGCVGWLKKEGKNVKSWKWRYFTLYGSKLSYYKSKTKTLLRSVIVENVVAHPSISLGLIVSTVGGRKLLIRGESKDEFNKWLDAIQAAVTVERRRKSTVVETPMTNMVLDCRSSLDLKSSTSFNGWLEKEGQRFKTWKKRFFTVKNNALIYYSGSGKVARGHGIVRGVYEDETKRHTLVIEFCCGKTMRVTAPNEAEMNAWYQALSRGRASSSARTAVSDVSDDVIDSDFEGKKPQRANRLSRFDSQDYINDSITNDTIMRLRDEEGKGTMLNSVFNTSRSFKGELAFDEEEEDFGLSTSGADYYRKLQVEEARIQKQRSEEKVAKTESPITGCAPCCNVM